MAKRNTELKLEAEKELIATSYAYTAALRDKDEAKIFALEAVCEKAMKQYNENALIEFCDDCFEYDDEGKPVGIPLVNALKKLRYQTMRYRVANDKETGLPTCTTYYADVDIPLAYFERYACDVKKLDSAGVNHEWIYLIEKFTQLMSVYICTEIGADMKRLKDSYYIRDVARKLELGETPTSKTQIQKLLQKVSEAMIGTEFKTTSHDASYLMHTLVNKDKRSANTVVFPTSKTVSGLIGDILHRVIIDGEYKMKFREKKA